MDLGADCTPRSALLAMRRSGSVSVDGSRAGLRRGTYQLKTLSSPTESRGGKEMNTDAIVDNNE